MIKNVIMTWIMIILQVLITPFALAEPGLKRPPTVSEKYCFLNFRLPEARKK